MIERVQEFANVLVQPLVDPASRTFVPYLIIAAILGVFLVGLSTPKQHRTVCGRIRAGLGLKYWRHPSSVTDLQLLLAHQFLRILGALPRMGSSWGLAVGMVLFLDRSVGQPEVPIVPTWMLSVGYTLVLFVVWDLSRFVLHLLLHRIPFLWSVHQVHHSAEVLTPLTFHRAHPLESLLYDLRGVLSTGLMAGGAYWLFRGSAVEFTLFGVHGLGVVCNAISGNLRHSHVWWRFGPAVERWLISPAQHQLHHSRDVHHYDSNFGTWLACWDRWMGTLVLAPAQASLEFGLRDANHRSDDLIGALVSPVMQSVRILVQPLRRMWIFAFCLLLAEGVARAEEAEDDEAEWEQSDGEMVVVDEGGVPRIAGSAHVIDEAQLERHEYNDIHQILGSVPGVYLRGEEGFGLRPNIGMRGGNSDRSAKITLMEDGILLSPSPYAAPAAYYFPLVTRLTGVEVIKGAAAIRYGPQTIGGAINLITRPIPDETQAAIDVGAGLHKTVKAHGYAGGGGDWWGVLAEVAHLSSSGFKTLDTGGPTGFDRQDVMLKGEVRSSKAADVFNSALLKLGYGREMSNETYLGLTQADFNEDPNRRYAASHGDQMKWNRTQAALIWSLVAGNDFDARTIVYHHRLKRAWTKLNRFSGGPGLYDLLTEDPGSGQGATYMDILRGDEDSLSVDHLLMRGTNDRQFDSYGVQNVMHHRVGIGIVDNELELGMRYHLDDVARTHTEDPHEMVNGKLKPTNGDVQTILDRVTTARALAIHLHDDLGIGPVHLVPGLRFERITTAAGTPETGVQDPQTLGIWLPGVGVYADVTEWLGLLAGLHKGFSPVPPDSPEETVPETAWNYETGTRLQHGGFRAEWIGFLSKYDNLTGQCTLSGGCTEEQLDTQFNGGRAKVYGMEAGVGQDIALPAGFTLGLSVNYAYTFAQFLSSFDSDFPQFGEVEGGFMLPYVPSHQGSGSVYLEHERATVSVTTHGRSTMRDSAGNEETPDEFEIPSIVQTDVAAEYRFNNHFSVYATTNNIAGVRRVQSWRPYGARPSTPFQAMLGLKAQL